MTAFILTMNYKKIYNSIISKAKKRKLPKNKYVEVHHIVPKSFFKSIKLANQKNNLVELLPEEHWICHLLLVKFCTGIEQDKMKQAILVMSGTKRSKLKCTNKRYAKRKKNSAYRKKKKVKIELEKKKNNKNYEIKKSANKKLFKASKIKTKGNISKKKKSKKRKRGKK
jgi:hypothetical protein